MTIPAKQPPLPTEALEQRRAQIYPVLSEADMRHVRRFGPERHFEAGETIYRAGQQPPVK